jgi:hypothetical protein
MAISAPRWTRGSSFVVGAALFLLPASASAGDAALAESLFQEGKKLMAKKAYAEACPKLAESQRLDPGGGTLFTLAVCHESEGKTASAWSEFTEAAAIAKRDGRADRERLASKHAKDLEPKLNMLAITVAPGAKVPGFELKRDGNAIGEAAWSTPSPIDPGEHQLSASAPGKRPWSTHVVVAATEKTTTVTVPVLEDEPVVAAPEKTTDKHVPAAAPPPKSDGLKIAGLAVAGIGVASIGVGVFFGLRAASQSGEANDRCPQTQCNDRGAVDLQESAQSSALLSTILFGVGAAAVLGGGAMFIAGSMGGSKTALYVSPTGAGVAGRW